MNYKKFLTTYCLLNQQVNTLKMDRVIVKEFHCQKLNLRMNIYTNIF